MISEGLENLRIQMYSSGVKEDLRRLIWQIAITGKYISARISESNRKFAGTANASGESQMALDIYADNILQAHLEKSGFVRQYASEEREEIITIGEGDEEYIITADPLDGSSLVDVNLAIGTIIGIHKGELFTTGRESLVAAMYILYGPLITCVYSAGKGVFEFVLDREGEYILSQEVKIKEQGSIYGVGGLRSKWTESHDAYIRLLEIRDYKLRYSGGFVPDINQIFIKGGGVFSYPALKESPNGKLRLLFELQPMAFIAEQAGGAATDGKINILDIPVEKLHQRAPVYIGSKKEVEWAQQ
jgi:fructose-1,6-bisphosphatase I